MEGANVARRRRRCRPRQRARSRGVDAVEVAVEKLLRGGVTENFSRETIDEISEEANFIGSIVRNALAFGNETPQHTIVALVRAFFTGRIRMGEVRLQLTVLQQRKPCELRSVIGCHR